MSVTAFLKRHREHYLDSHFDMTDWRVNRFSGNNFALWSVASAASATHCVGRVLDAGAGRGAWRTSLLQTATIYESVDIAARGQFRPTWEADICDMPAVPDARFDAVACHQVLEHVRSPGAALSELHRVLAPGGHLILSVPHLSRQHELPHDYFRFTPQGVRAVVEDAGFDIVSLQTYGGLMTFLHHQVSLLFPGLVLGVPVVGLLAAGVNAALSQMFNFVDGLVDRAGLFANGVVVVARKPA